MSGTNVKRRVGRRRLEVNDFAPWVAEFTQHLLSTGYTVQTARRYDAVARHLAHWLALTEIAVTDIDETVIDRFARHRCRASASVVRRTSPASTSWTCAASSHSSASTES